MNIDEYYSLWWISLVDFLKQIQILGRFFPWSVGGLIFFRMTHKQDTIPSRQANTWQVGKSHVNGCFYGQIIYKWEVFIAMFDYTQRVIWTHYTDSTCNDLSATSVEVVSGRQAFFCNAIDV